MKGFTPNKIVTNDKNNLMQLELGIKQKCKKDCDCKKCSN